MQTQPMNVILHRTLGSIDLKKHHFPLQGEKLPFVIIQIQEEPGKHMVQVGDTLGLMRITTDATMYMWIEQDLN